MFIAFFLIWVVLNGRVTFEIVWMGLLICAALYFFVCRFMGYSLKRELALLKQVPAALRYAALLIKEIISANLSVLKLVFSAKYEVAPVLVKFRVPLKTKAARVALANSITLTPGTITAMLSEDEYLVHCLDESLSVGLTESAFVKELEKMEEGDSHVA